MKIALTIAYDGAAYDGWQSQSGGNAVQDVIERVLSQHAGEPVRLHGAGRTDRGVHAFGQRAHFEAAHGCRGEPALWKAACNVSLPPDIRILHAEEAVPDFHARFDATAKHYRYIVSTAEVLSPFLAGRVWRRFPPPDAGLLRSALALFEGTHDFSSFTPRPGTGRRGSVRTLLGTRVFTAPPDLLVIDLLGDGFLYKMARFLAGQAIRCACGKESIETLRGLIDSPRPGLLHHIAPAEGLYLARVFYNDAPMLPPENSQPFLA